MEQLQKGKISGVREQSRNHQSFIASQFVELRQILTEKEQRFLRDLREDEERILNHMEENLRMIQENLNSIQEELSRLQEQADQTDSLLFLEEEADCKRRVRDDDWPLSVRDDPIPFENFNHLFLLKTVLKEMFDSIKQVSVTLDVETASPRLEVSEDRKRVRWTETRRGLPDTGKRFTDNDCVLGSEGFTSGRYYWEVEAGSRYWSLGVAAESVERKGWVTPTPETGVWSIWMDGDELHAVTSPPSPLPARPFPRRVGVYLSYESGTVSFYDAATKSHLHTFTGNKFTEKLYPFFGLWDEDQWLRICSGSAPDSRYCKGASRTTSVKNSLNQEVEEEKMAAKDRFESWTEEAVCPICLDFFTDPVSLECGHNFCRSCITQSWDREGKNSCPECREEFTDRTLRVNRALVRLSEKARALSLNQTEKENKLQCEDHQEELKLFCETDKKLICLICRDAREHKTHNFMPINEAVAMCKDQVKSSLQSLTKKKLEFEDVEQLQKGKISRVREQSRNHQSFIASQFAELRQFLTDKEQRFLRDLREDEERILKHMEENLRMIQEKLNSIQEELSRLQEQADQTDSLLFLKEEADCKRRVRDDDWPLSVRDDSIPFENFNHLFLLKTVLKETFDSIKQVSVTLDEKTAHPQLDVSADRKSVKWIGCWRKSYDSGKRFMQKLCIVGSEGFTSGRYYWEVEFGDNRGCSLGVAAESVDKNGVGDLTPEAGVWSIQRQDDKFVALTSSPSPLPARPIPGRVGVYLSYESGTVSFYDADTKSHLHTFTGNKFTEKLYPYFGTWHVNQWLRIGSGSAPGV
ncbi:E3 ubiquitin-protein ligase TRIM39-like [Leucoraja erinacea]|uniref:E3 ubiquitin-protein ligase TRIM39-like n=1 Tax=Leucoraja erinaceus TaxID=7782 RepID=UPI002454C4BE|nr:E3 ubiquitin-protein ligase TRIM39-like [Leucoraja erinacea]